MSCYKFSEENLEALKRGERLFVPGVDPEKYDLWKIEYTRAPMLGADNYFGLDDSPKNLSAIILAIDGETSEEAANRFRIWCERVYNSLSNKSPSATITSIRYVKTEENSEI